MKKINMTNVKEAGEFSRPTAGAYICTITDVEDVPAKEYLKITYDIAEGEFAGYYAETRAAHPDWTWSGAYVKSYKTKALPMFKRFCTAVSRSNGNYVFDGGAVNADETILIGKRVGLLMQEEEYYSNSGDKRTRLIVSREFSTDKLAEQKTPAPKLLKEEPALQTPSGFINIGASDDDESEVPFD